MIKTTLAKCWLIFNCTCTFSLSFSLPLSLSLFHWYFLVKYLHSHFPHRLHPVFLFGFAIILGILDLDELPKMAVLTTIPQLHWSTSIWLLFSISQSCFYCFTWFNLALHTHPHTIIYSHCSWIHILPHTNPLTTMLKTYAWMMSQYDQHFSPMTSWNQRGLK